MCALFECSGVALKGKLNKTAQVAVAGPTCFDAQAV
jgi:hypothetical protein